MKRYNKIVQINFVLFLNQANSFYKLLEKQYHLCTPPCQCAIYKGNVIDFTNKQKMDTTHSQMEQYNQMRWGVITRE